MNESNVIITLGRQTGSGGRKIGRKLAEELNIPFYDRELLTRAAKESGLSQALFEGHDEKPTNSFLYSLVMDTYPYGYASSFNGMPIDHKVFLAQFDAIKKIGSEGACVIVGRCADYALENNPNLLSVFIYGEMEDKIQRLREEYDVSEAKAREMILKTDKKRSSYYNYYSNKKWGDAKSYHLCLNSSAFGIEGCVGLIRDAILRKNNG
ncbi:MAG: cytidylate kinase-like family protein [Lachnospiraceae bacterium]|nr:cytidylate kinase-like family protein [Lachnospiraceae bacterium]